MAPPPYVWPTWKVEVELDSVWTDVTADVVGAYGASLSYGIRGGGPLDVVADAGEFACTLRNDPYRAGIPQGRYSPRHLFARPGWDFGVSVRLTFYFGGAAYVKHRGKLLTIDPEPGVAHGQVCHIASVDAMQDLIGADVRALAIETEVSETTLIAAVLDAVPAEAQPISRTLDEGVERFPVAFHDLKQGAKAGALLHEIVRSAGPGRLFLSGDGTCRYQSRISQQLSSTPAVTLADTMRVFIAPSTTEDCFNRIRITTRGQVVGTASETIYETPTTSPIRILGGQSLDVWCTYTDPDDRQTTIGGVEVDDGILASGTHYTATNEDGTGDLSGNVSVTLEAFASTGKATIANAGTQTAYVRLSLRGRAIRDVGPTTSEAFSSQRWDRLLAFEMPYQNAASVGQTFADYYASVYAAIDRQIESVEFTANHDAGLLTQALAREPGDRVRLSEAITGLRLVDSVIQSVDLTVGAGLSLICRWGLAPAITLGSPWQLEVSALDGTEGLAL